MKDMRIYELVEQFNNLVESNPISKRYITAIRLALKRYQQEHHVTSFKQINVGNLFKNFIFHYFMFLQARHFLL